MKRMQRIKYTNSFKDFVEYCNEKLEEYFKNRLLMEQTRNIGHSYENGQKLYDQDSNFHMKITVVHMKRS